jgi:hypothetical protein
MSQLLYLLPALACPAGMAVMMWVMMRKTKSSTLSTAQEQSAGDAELAALRVEIAQMRDAAAQPDLKPSASPGLYR